jgi:nucleotide-binding universal stress UspA family protein
MTLRSILVHVDLSPDARRRTGLARDLAVRFGARLVGACAAEPSDAALLMGGLPAGLLDLHEARLKEVFRTQHEHFSDAAQAVPFDWRSGIAAPRAFLRRTACLADLVVVGRASAEAAGHDFHLAPADAVMALGRPVLVVPPDVGHLAADHVVVAWKTGRTAALAVQLALPLLIRASRVTVVGVGEETSQAELDDVREHLTRHGVKAQTHWRGAEGMAPDRALVEAANHLTADLIVCGAYGRSHLFEWALGGVTEGLLADSPLCCLMAH